MKQNNVDKDIKITTTENTTVEDQIKIGEGSQVIKVDSGVLYKPEEASSVFNIDNGDFFEERSNPLSSKGN